MPLNLSKARPVKTAILEELARNGPLAAKETYHRIGTRLEKTVSYQAVHKAIQELVKDGILREEGKKYEINPDWAKNLKTFAERAERKATKKPTLDFGEIQNATSQTLTFDSYMEALYALLENIAKEIVEKKADVTVAHWHHPWPITCVSSKEYEQIRQVMAIGKHYALVNQKTALDIALISFWENLGKKVIVGAQCAKEGDLVVTQDKVIQVILSPRLLKNLDTVFKKSRKGNEFSGLYDEVFKLKGEVKVIITKNAPLANQIRKETLRLFKTENSARKRP